MDPNDELRERIDRSLDVLRTGFAHDGGDLEVSALASAAQVDITLVLKPDACAECIVSGDLLQTIVETTVRNAAPQIEQVRVHDPRVPA